MLNEMNEVRRHLGLLEAALDGLTREAVERIDGHVFAGQLPIMELDALVRNARKAADAAQAAFDHAKRAAKSAA